MSEIDDLRELVRKYDVEVDYLRGRLEQTKKDKSTAPDSNNTSSTNLEEAKKQSRQHQKGGKSGGRYSMSSFPSDIASLRVLVREAVRNSNFNEGDASLEAENDRLKGELEEALTMILELKDEHQNLAEDLAKVQREFEKERDSSKRTIRTLRARLEEVETTLDPSSSSSSASVLSSSVQELKEQLQRERISSKAKEHVSFSFFFFSLFGYILFFFFLLFFFFPCAPCFFFLHRNTLI